MGKTTDVNREKTLLDKAISESFKLNLNAGKYTLNQTLLHIKTLGKLSEFPNMVALNKKMPGIILINCGGMPIFKLPPQDDKETKKKSTTKSKSKTTSKSKALF